MLRCARITPRFCADHPFLFFIQNTKDLIAMQMMAHQALNKFNINITGDLLYDQPTFHSHYSVYGNDLQY
ncbi:hypothetical protein E2I00_006161 [Balaenoptera physalus]|uniref:Uncharacterized protein n=1 Tax=Balaenoptera physalus TaxID=9770 RepID=A0A643AUU2_BALPH|nr:hypothetical protein E2I00_006161 [Balaenoptera physalus]